MLMPAFAPTPSWGLNVWIEFVEERADVGPGILAEDDARDAFADAVAAVAVAGVPVGAKGNLSLDASADAKEGSSSDRSLDRQ
jgi:hypothetical protein